MTLLRARPGGVLVGVVALAVVVLLSSCSANGTVKIDQSSPHLSDIEVGQPRVPYQEVPPLPQKYAQVLEVPVSFVIDTDGSDGFSSGPTNWGFTVVRQSAREPWLIDSMGV